jgi:Protein of unknown function (DUF2865)
MLNRAFGRGLRWRSLRIIGLYLAAAVALAGAASWSSATLMSVVLSTTEAHIGPPPAAAEARPAPADTSATPAATASSAVDANPATSQTQRPAFTPSRIVRVDVPAPSRRENQDDDEESSRPRPIGTFCVRLCDGFYWPISHATASGAIGRDQTTCERACPGAPVRLYIHPVPGGAPDHMQDLSGQPYGRLKTAYRFQTTYDAACRCTAQPWEQQAQDRHRVYALEAAQRKGNTQASTELTALRAKVDADRRSLATQSKTIAAKLVADKVLTPSGALVRGPNDAFGTQMGLGLKSPDDGNRGSPAPKGSRAWIERVFTGGGGG